MSFSLTNNLNILEKSMHYRKIRQDLIASNIANSDTPFYRPKDIRFEEALAKELKKDNDELELAKTSKMHLDSKDELQLKPTIFFRDGHLARNDGNSVDIDIETSEMAKNGIAYNATLKAAKKYIEMAKLAIDSSKNI